VSPRPRITEFCTVEGCDTVMRARGLCGIHYRRMRVRGTTDLPVLPTVAERFWAKVNKSGPIPEFNPSLGNCWDWTASCNESRGGYGQFDLDRRTRKAHAVSWELSVGPIPDGLIMDHLCRRHVCVNPSHLEPVTDGENFHRGMHLNAIAIRTGVCRWGHEQTPENTVVFPSHPEGMCLPCIERRNRARFHFVEVKP